MKFPMPAQNVDPYTLSNDENGYAVYTMILFANSEQQAAVQKIRDAVKVRRSMLPAHVTVKGPICQIPSIPAIQRIIDEVTHAIGSIPVAFAGMSEARTFQNGEVASLQSIELTPEIVELHSNLLSALDPVSTTAYPMESRGNFAPHLTIYHEPEPELESLGERLLGELDIGTGFQADRVSLMGHVGTPFRGDWRLISEHRFE